MSAEGRHPAHYNAQVALAGGEKQEGEQTMIGEEVFERSERHGNPPRAPRSSRLSDLFRQAAFFLNPPTA